jgi:hypothetical protein
VSFRPRHAVEITHCNLATRVLDFDFTLPAMLALVGYSEMNTDTVSSVLTELKLRPEPCNNPAMDWHIVVQPVDDGFIVLGFPATREADNYCAMIEDAIRSALAWATEPGCSAARAALRIDRQDTCLTKIFSSLAIIGDKSALHSLTCQTAPAGVIE